LHAARSVDQANVALGRGTTHADRLESAAVLAPPARERTLREGALAAGARHVVHRGRRGPAAERGEELMPRAGVAELSTDHVRERLLARGRGVVAHVAPRALEEHLDPPVVAAFSATQAHRQVIARLDLA